MTYSLLARDPETGALGVATQSHYLAVGAMVTWGEAGVGVVATQAITDRSYGPRGLNLMRQGIPADEALARLLAADPDRELRQIGYLDAAGGLGLHTGTRCVAAAGMASNGHVAVLGNILADDAVLDAALLGFQEAGGDLAARLLAGLRSAEHAGGDLRGQQSAALLVVDRQRTDDPWNGVLRDLRVDDHPDPIGELARILALHGAFDELSRVAFEPAGPVLGRRGSDTEFADAAARLADVAAVLGPNPEATFWSAVLHARWGRLDDARHLLAEASRHNPRLLKLIGPLVDAGVLTPQDAAGVCPVSAAPAATGKRGKLR
ncbi:DUF1028 domain-containing protein [Mycobacterium sp. pUA109]|uniref:DUF1028 domain-containing protein n=1 Tax=Mycobacterium sp. pUA109 TaxID=3238982 RepID=UPI00351B9161